jgi:adenine-specific DNA methylase
MFEKLINLIFGCKHPERDHSALPFTQDGKSYRVCLKCGTAIAYSVDDFEYVTRGYRRRKRREAARA